MRFSVLSSSSKANSTFLEVGRTRLLIDCGLSCRETERRLLGLGIPAESISAIVVTHEHRDHIAGISVFSRKFKVPVYSNIDLTEIIDDVFGAENFLTGRKFSIGDAAISPFRIIHDAADPVGFAIEGEGLKFTHVTDLGKVTDLVRQRAAGSNALVLESNHDPQMLIDCDYPWELKQRIASAHGHLSNEEAAELLDFLCHEELYHVVLAHLSENSNRPDLALTAARERVPEYRLPSVVCGARTHMTPLFEVGEAKKRLAAG